MKFFLISFLLYAERAVGTVKGKQREFYSPETLLYAYREKSAVRTGNHCMLLPDGSLWSHSFTTTTFKALNCFRNEELISLSLPSSEKHGRFPVIWTQPSCSVVSPLNSKQAGFFPGVTQARSIPQHPCFRLHSRRVVPLLSCYLFTLQGQSCAWSPLQRTAVNI